jgi:hypothetical protein
MVFVNDKKMFGSDFHGMFCQLDNSEPAAAQHIRESKGGKLILVPF